MAIRKICKGKRWIYLTIAERAIDWEENEKPKVPEGHAQTHDSIITARAP